jgi:hypothetical protein
VKDALNYSGYYCDKIKIFLFQSISLTIPKGLLANKFSTLEMPLDDISFEKLSLKIMFPENASRGWQYLMWQFIVWFFSHQQNFTVKLGYYQPNQTVGEVLSIAINPVQSVYLHENYSTSNQTNDIALIELPNAVDFSGSFQKLVKYRP